MNNAKIAKNTLVIETPADISPYLRQKKVELVDIIEAIQAIETSPSWEVLKRHVFDGLCESLNRQIKTEKDYGKIMYLQGAISVAEKYADFKKFGEIYRNELMNINKQLE